MAIHTSMHSLTYYEQYVLAVYVLKYIYLKGGFLLCELHTKNVDEWEEVIILPLRILTVVVVEFLDMFEHPSHSNFL
jgi:hypothetical protein